MGVFGGGAGPIAVTGVGRGGEVIADGETLFESYVLRGADSPGSIDVDVSGKKTSLRSISGTISYVLPSGPAVLRLLRELLSRLRGFIELATENGLDLL